VRALNDRAVNHTAEDARGVFDGLAAAELDVILGKEHDVSAKFADADFKRNTSPGGSLGKNDGPSLASEGEVLVRATSRLHLGSEMKEGLQMGGVGFFDREKFHR